MSLPEPSSIKPRLFTPDETVRYLGECQAYTAAEFGDKDAFSVDYLVMHRTRGVQFYHAYGDFSSLPPRLMGLASCMFISYAMFEAMQAGSRKENALDPWVPEDGAAILWVSAVVSDHPGGIARCLSAVLDELVEHPYKHRIDRLGAVCSGPQGYVMGKAFRLTGRETPYSNGWIFMDRPMAHREVDTLRRDLDTIWNMTRARDAIREGRQIWGPSWNTPGFAQPPGLEEAQP